ncbi:DUF6992 family protein [Eisenibacter elegans]|uniref:DUF6992 family protein n=1 Tax=Eisenibacter elegans TaxID=997 RepID=UPI000400D895|nr:hypothetical protein [Eisenibacter elegans]
MAKKKYYIYLSLFCWVVGAGQLWAQEQQLWQPFEERRRELQRSGSAVLGSWALLNIGSGLAMASQTNGSTQHFYEMNAYWNIVNLALAVPGFIAARPGRQPQYRNPRESLLEQRKIERIFLINAGLDLGYVAGGYYLSRLSSRDKPAQEARFVGFGQSIMAQGAFLLGYDLWMYLRHRRNRLQHHDSLEQRLSLYPQPYGMGLIYRF